MRAGWRLGAGLAVLLVGIGCWWLLSPRPGTGGSDSEPSRAGDSRVSTVLQAVLQATAPQNPSSSEGLTLQGTVRGSQRPVSGARVLASIAVPGETLSTWGCDDPGETRLTECLGGEAGQRIREAVEQRHGEALVRAQAVTAEDGSFQLSGLEPGTYVLWVESEEGVVFPVEAPAGGPPVELRLRAGVRLSGSVTDGTDALVSGALVTAVFATHSRFFEALTDGTGHYQLGPLPPGEFVVVVAKQGLLSAIRPVVAYASETRRDFKLERPGRIAGRVLRSGTPVEGATVELRGDLTIWQQSSTDAAGRFSFEQLPPDRYVLIARDEGAGASAKVQLEEATQAEEVTLTLTPAAFIRGVVRNEAQEPVTLAMVELTPASEAEEQPIREPDPEMEAEPSVQEDAISFPQVVYTDEEGHYQIGPIPPDRYSLRVVAHGYQVPELASREFTAGTASWDVTLSAALTFEGELVDAEGLPVAGESLMLNGEDLENSEWDGDSTTPDGRFTFSFIQPGKYRLSLEGQRVRPQELLVTLPAPPMRIVGERLLRLMGDVQDASGTPLTGVSVELWPEATSPKRRAEARSGTDSAGRFELYVSTPGRYRVVAELRMDGLLLSASQDVEVGGKDEPPVHLRFEEGHRLSGMVVDWRGQPLRQAPVQLLSEPRVLDLRTCGAMAGCVHTDSEGRFTFPQVSGEQFFLCIRAPGYLPLESTPENASCVRVNRNEQEVRIVVGRDVFIVGQVLYPDGSPVTRYRLNGREVQEENGGLSLRIRRPGMEQIEVSAPGLQSTWRTAPEFREGVELLDIGDIILGP